MRTTKMVQPTRRRGRLPLAAIAGVAAILGSLSGSQAVDLTDGYVVFNDAARSTSFAVSVGAGSPYRGHFQFAVAGLGLVWPATPALVDPKSDHSVVVTYSGAGQLDRGAVLDPVFGFHEPSGVSELHQIVLQAQINPDRITATATLWLDGIQYHLVDRAATPDAGADLASIVIALNAEDWSTLYDWSYSGVTAQLSRQAFIAAVAAAFAPNGHVTAVSVSAPPTYGDGSAGFDTAAARLAVVMSSGGVSQTYDVLVSLIWENGSWKILSLPLASG